MENLFQCIYPLRGKEESWEQASRYWAAGPPTHSPDTDCPGRLSASGSKRLCFPPFPRQPEPPTCPGWGPLTVTQFLRSGSPCWPQRERTRPSPLPGHAALAQVGPECVRRLPPKPAAASPVPDQPGGPGVQPRAGKPTPFLRAPVLARQVERAWSAGAAGGRMGGCRAWPAFSQ